MHAIVQHADKLYEDRKWHEALEYLEQYGETEELDLLWRLMRINYRVGKHITPDRKAAERMAARGMELSERALKISDKHFLCQKVRTAVSLAGQTLTRGESGPRDYTAVSRLNSYKSLVRETRSTVEYVM